MISPVAAPPITIEIGGSNSKAYKSIDSIVWEEVPSFVVLTGLNGSGKTQLLELLAYKLTGVLHPEFGNMQSIRLNITGDTYGPDSVAYIPSRWDISGAPGLNLGELQNAKQQLYSQLQQHNVNQDFIGRSRRARLERMFGVERLEEVAPERFVRELPDDFAYMLDEMDITAGLAHVFLAYRLRAAEAREAGTSEADLHSALGPAPWEVVNETFAAAGFPFQVNSPVGTKILDRFELRFDDIQHHRKLRPMDLSSGERTLLGLVLWLYNSSHHGRFPKLFLLDEPDAHLHPSMTRHFLDVLADVLVARYGVRVILTTHSPSTVALAPDSALFEMRRGSPRVVRSPSKAATVGLLTAGLVTVSPGTRHVLVEDEDDVRFFEMVRDVLSDYGPTRDPRAMRPAPSVAFMPASLGAGKGKIAGGKSVVIQWLDKLDVPPLNELFRGVIDRDVGNIGSSRVAVLSRYSIENYYLDPLLIFALVSDQGTAPPVPGVAIAQGQEHLIKSLPAPLLQNLVDTIFAGIAAELGTLSEHDVQKQRVTFTNGIALDYPAWAINRRGHDLLPIYQRVYGGSTVVTPPRLSRAFKRVRLVPSELADIMDLLQA